MNIKLIIGIIILVLLLTGCGLINLDNFIIPDDIDFIELINELDTPEKIGNYMVNNFTFKFSPISSVNPYQLWKIKEGDCNDFALFGTFIANYHNYKTYQMIIYYGSIFTHVIAIYEEDLLSFTDNRSYYYGFDSFEEIAIESCKHINKELQYYKVIGLKSKINRDTSENTVIYETFDDGNCGELGYCPPPKEFDIDKK